MGKRIFSSWVVVLSLCLAIEGFAGDFTLTSPQLSAGNSLGIDQVYNGFGCKGANISPELHWTGEPAGTLSFAVTVFDPDAPTGNGWWHWIVLNIPASVHSLVAGSGTIETTKLPQSAIQCRSSFGISAYGGACPPQAGGVHHYEFTVWALGVKTLPFAENATGAMVIPFLYQHQLAKAVLTVLYGR